MAVLLAAAATPPVVAGSIVGRVTLDGTALPVPTPVVNATDPESCGARHTLDDLVVDRESRGVRDVLVALDGVPAAAIPAPLPADRLVLDNRGCTFHPHAAVATVGSTLVAVNSDPLLHTVHLYGAAAGNLALPGRGQRSERVLRKPGLVAVRCDVHGWMQAFIRVDPHPFHAVSDAGGCFRIDGVPAGDYTLELWHQRLGRRRRPVRIAGESTTDVEVRYPWNEEGEDPP